MKNDSGDDDTALTSLKDLEQLLQASHLHQSEHLPAPPDLHQRPIGAHRGPRQQRGLHRREQHVLHHSHMPLRQRPMRPRLTARCAAVESRELRRHALEARQLFQPVHLRAPYPSATTRCPFHDPRCIRSSARM